jgi:hypothetical protein
VLSICFHDYCAWKITDGQDCVTSEILCGLPFRQVGFRSVSFANMELSSRQQIGMTSQLAKNLGDRRSGWECKAIRSIVWARMMVFTKERPRRNVGSEGPDFSQT